MYCRLVQHPRKDSPMETTLDRGDISNVVGEEVVVEGGVGGDDVFVDEDVLMLSVVVVDVVGSGGAGEISPEHPNKNRDEMLSTLHSGDKSRDVSPVHPSKKDPWICVICLSGARLSVERPEHRSKNESPQSFKLFAKGDKSNSSSPEQPCKNPPPIIQMYFRGSISRVLRFAQFRRKCEGSSWSCVVL